jgi:hypothetical protein
MGYAYLRDGTRIDYDQYINEHPHWQVVRNARFRFDGGKCVICHRDLTGMQFQTHHMDYRHLGDEHMTDVVTMCPKHHALFHRNWVKQKYWIGRESGHWEVFDLEHTARLCRMYYKEDKFICKDVRAPNLCNSDTDREYIDKYVKTLHLDKAPIIDPHDLCLFVRNKRYEMVFEAESRGLTVEQFLDECYGPKVRGKNPLRAEAGKKNGTFDHTLESFHRHYSENKNINILMKEVKDAETQQF